MNALEIEKMSTAQRLQAMEILWDALLHDKVDIESSRMAPECSGRKKRTNCRRGDAKFLFLKELKAMRDV